MRHAIVLCSLLPLLVGATGTGSTQDVALGTRAELVRLDVVVTDADGKLVRDLTREDFQLLEDGKVQTLSQFLAVHAGRPAAPVVPAEASAPKPPASVETTAPAPGGPGRYVVVFVDDLHIARGNFDFTKEALRRFVAEFLGPDDRVAIVTSGGPGGAEELTRDRAALGAAIDRLTFRQAAVA